MSTPRLGPSTIAIHGGKPHRGADWTPAVTPIYQSATFRNPLGSDAEVLYTRYGNNPNQVELASRYAALEGAEDALFLASGMAATALAHLAVLRPGDHLLAARWIYGGTRVLFDTEFARFGIEVSYVDPDQPREWRKAGASPHRSGLRPDARRSHPSRCRPACLQGSEHAIRGDGCARPASLR